MSASAALLASGCGGGGGGSSPPTPAPTFTVGGTVTGLSGTGLVLQNNGGDNRAITANGAFVFTTRLASGAAYDVTVSARPAAPSQACVVGNGDGNVANANVTGINVVCGAAPGKFLYVTAQDPVILRGYSINAITGGLLPIPVSNPPPHGSNPMSLAASPNGQFLYTANWLGGGTLSGYSINPSSGMLTAVPGSPIAVGASPSSITFRPDGAFLYVPYSSNLLAAFRVDAATGALTPVAGSPYTVGTSPGQPLVDPAGKFLYVPSSSPPQIAAFAIDAAQGTLAPLTPATYTGVRPNYLALGLGGTILYVSNSSAAMPPSNDSSISAFLIIPATGALSEIAGSPFGAGTAGGRIRQSADGRLLFVAGTNSQIGAAIITAFAVNQATGALTIAPVAPASSVQVGNAGSELSFGVEPSARLIAAVNSGATAAIVIPVNAATGSLGPAAFPTLNYFPTRAVLDPSGLFAYILESAGGLVHPYQIEPVGFFVNELPVPPGIGAGISLGQPLIVGSQ